ncbi:MAG: hypothetical protein ACREVW_05270, partial [Burkholderiales bacterium]
MKSKFPLLRPAVATLAAGLCVGMALAQAPRSGANLKAPDAPLPKADKLVLMPGEPAEPAPGSWGYDAKTGRFTAPSMAPDAYGPHPVEGSLPYLDQNSYAKNFKQEGFYPFVAGAGHSWQATFNWQGRRYLYDYEIWQYNVFDITDPHDVKLVGKTSFDIKG